MSENPKNPKPHSTRLDALGIGKDHKPFIIAEMSGNHNGSLEQAMAIVEAIAQSGAHALKLQTYTPDTMTLDLKEREFFISNPKSLWKERSLYDLYKEAMTPWEWHKPLFEKARSLGLIPFSTPFDSTAVDFLESLDVPIYKIASFENTDLDLIAKVAQTGKPMIISTGLATVSDIADAVDCARSNGCEDLILLKCTSSYPASPSQSHLRTIPHMAELFGCPVGLSDHTMGIGAAVASVALGAVVIEKHVTLRREDGGVDSDFSLEPHELRSLVDETARAHSALGRISYKPSEEEQGSLQFKRSLYVTEDLKTGDVLTPSNLRAIRPGLGLPVKYRRTLLGKKLKQDVSKGTAASWDLFE